MNISIWDVLTIFSFCLIYYKVAYLDMTPNDLAKMRFNAV